MNKLAYYQGYTEGLKELEKEANFASDIGRLAATPFKAAYKGVKGGYKLARGATHLTAHPVQAPIDTLVSGAKKVGSGAKKVAEGAKTGATYVKGKAAKVAGGAKTGATYVKGKAKDVGKALKGKEVQELEKKIKDIERAIKKASPKTVAARAAELPTDPSELSKLLESLTAQKSQILRDKALVAGGAGVGLAGLGGAAAGIRSLTSKDKKRRR